MLIDSVYRKDKNYYPQVFLEIYKYVVKEISSRYEKPFKLGDRIFFRVFFFSSLENSFLKYKKFFKFWARKFHLPKYKKNFFWKNVINFFRVHWFFEIGQKSAPSSP